MRKIKCLRIGKILFEYARATSGASLTKGIRFSWHNPQFTVIPNILYNDYEMNLLKVVYGMGSAPTGQWVRMTRDILTDLDK